VPARVERLLGLCSEYFRDGSGSDGMMELELALARGERHPWLLLTLGQLYLMAGQGVPELLPTEGPAADTGSWARNRPRLLGRARELLIEAGRARPDDAAVDYLLADVARAGGDMAGAKSVMAQGADKCTGGRSFRIMRLYQELDLHPAELEATTPPEYPEAAILAGRAGPVALDLLLDPRGRVRQVVVLAAPGEDLARAAAAAFRRSRFAPSRVGKYPVWSWLRVTTNFSLAGEP
jgi:TonB family protein